MSFKDFLLQRTPTYDAQGDFVRLVLADANFPADADWEEMRIYFFESFGSFFLAEAGEIVWKRGVRTIRFLPLASALKGTAAILR